MYIVITFIINNLGRSNMCAGAGYYFSVSELQSGTLCALLISLQVGNLFRRKYES